MEIWKTIKDYTNYQVSNYGNVRRVLSMGRTKVLVSCDNGNGYMRLNLYKNSCQTKFYVHRLVASAFMSNPRSLPEVHHKDHNKTNNNLSNLEWVTAKENICYKINYYRNLKRAT